MSAKPCPTITYGDPKVPRGAVRLHCALAGQTHQETRRDGRHHLAVLNGETHRWTDAGVAEGGTR